MSRAVRLFPLILAGCVAAEPPLPETLALETTANTPVRLGVYGFWREDCSALPVEIETVAVPARGVIDIAAQSYRIPEAVPDGAPEGCAGRVIDGKALAYLPDSDWSGQDRLTLIARGGGQSVSDSFEIAVR